MPSLRLRHAKELRAQRPCAQPPNPAASSFTPASVANPPRPDGRTIPYGGWHFEKVTEVVAFTPSTPTSPESPLDEPRPRTVSAEPKPILVKRPLDAPAPAPGIVKRIKFSEPEIANVTFYRLEPGEQLGHHTPLPLGVQNTAGLGASFQQQGLARIDSELDLLVEAARPSLSYFVPLCSASVFLIPCCKRHRVWNQAKR